MQRILNVAKTRNAFQNESTNIKLTRQKYHFKIQLHSLFQFLLSYL